MYIQACTTVIFPISLRVVLLQISSFLQLQKNIFLLSFQSRQSLCNLKEHQCSFFSSKSSILWTSILWSNQIEKVKPFYLLYSIKSELLQAPTSPCQLFLHCIYDIFHLQRYDVHIQRDLVMLFSGIQNLRLEWRLTTIPIITLICFYNLSDWFSIYNSRQHSPSSGSIQIFNAQLV